MIEQIERSTRGPLLLGLVFAAGAASVLWGQANMQTGTDTTQPSFTSGLTDLLLAGVYVCALLVLLRTPLRPALRAIFAPLGRMALTNYLTATLLVLAAAHPRPAGRPVLGGGVPSLGSHPRGPVVVLHPLAAPLPPGPHRVALALGHLGSPPAPQPGQDVMSSGPES